MIKLMKKNRSKDRNGQDSSPNQDKINNPNKKKLEWRIQGQQNLIMWD